ncbi:MULTISPECIES: cytochrome P460 family protein [Pseudomonadota]|uniref:cytochrome P460 family protein n=1 Tax=Pseudomonadota TaxID=1224 RepID=UPI00093AA354|nr:MULTISPECIES: cytochrome P460 family protein [Pseudomonadota]MBX6317004.1 cytochrome P460 family protein [Pigmentiphaga sp.]
MSRLAIRIPFIVLAAGAALLLGLQAHAEDTRVIFPKDLELFVHYMTVKRGNVTEHISTTPEAIEAVKKGQPIPNGTQFVLTDYRDGELYRYFVMEKGPGWGADYDERRRTGDWQYQWFWPNKQINLKENTARCMSCHSSQKRNDYLFTAQRLSEFRGTPLE